MTKTKTTGHAPVAWTTTGPVRGSCGHRHKTADAAWDCLDADRRACRSLSSRDHRTRCYSDRVVVVVEVS